MIQNEKSMKILNLCPQSTRYGRLNTIIWCSVLGAIFGCLQALPAFLMTFEFYLALEFCVATSTAGVLGACYVYNLEWVTAKYRVHLNTITSVARASHVIIIALAAWYYENNFVAYKLILVIPAFFLLFSYFAMKESPQWLLSQHKYEKVIRSIKMAGKINGRPPHDKTIEQIQNKAFHYGMIQDATDATKNGGYEKASSDDCEKVSNGGYCKQITLGDILKSKILGPRLIILSSVWLASVYANYGSVLGSSSIHSNKYISYALIGMAEIPGTLLTSVTMDRYGRRKTIGIALFTCGFMLLLSVQIAAEQQIYRMIMHFIGRAAIKTAVAGLTTYTTELWPTSQRNTIFSICGLCGRFGSIFASLAMLLVRYNVDFPTMICGSITIVGAVLLFAFMPETLNSGKLPDTIEETIAIGKNRDKNSGDEEMFRSK